MKKLMLAVAILVAHSTHAAAMTQNDPPLPEHTCRLHSDGSIICTALTIGECQQLIAHVRLNESIGGLDVIPLSSRCEKIAPPSVGYRIIFELL